MARSRCPDLAEVRRALNDCAGDVDAAAEFLRALNNWGQDVTGGGRGRGLGASGEGQGRGRLWSGVLIACEAGGGGRERDGCGEGLVVEWTVYG